MTIWTTVVAVAVVSVTLKAIGPALLHDRQLGDRPAAVLDALAAALLAGLLVVDLFGARWQTLDWTPVPGLAVAVLLWRFRVPDLACVAAAVAVTGLVRLLAA